jgi:carbamoyl-phosphate synthase/aspartate carbamoyltransferase
MASQESELPMALELADGYFCQGISFGAHKSVAGELVFQTGMVGYSESITDPSYRGQILVFTFPLVGNYGVPSRDVMDELLQDLPAYFESNQIHIAGLVVATYAGEDYSHYLAASSLGTWLREQGVPAIHGVDTRLLTKKIREEGSMLGRLLLPNAVSDQRQQRQLTNGTNEQLINGHGPMTPTLRRTDYREIPWVNPNASNLVSEGKFANTPPSILSCPSNSSASHLVFLVLVLSFCPL